MVFTMVKQVLLFGALRRFGTQGILEVEVPATCSAAQLRALIKERIAASGAGNVVGSLVDSAACSDGAVILTSEADVTSASTLALLPPVCGG